MNSLAYIPASDGAANASLMTVTSIRAGGATTIQVNTVANAPTKFYASYGTPHTFTDPVTGETITIISESTAVDFAGTIDGSNVEIIEIAPGYTDNGNEVGDIIVIRPVTEWANNIFNLLSEAHEDDGALKNTALDAFYKPSEVSSVDFVASGGVIAQTVTFTGSFSDIVFYVDGLRYAKTGEANRAYTASKDTYVDVGVDGVVDYNEVANGAAAPALATDHIRVAKVITDGSGITSVVQYGTDGLGNRIRNTDPAPSYEEFFDQGPNQGKASRSWGVVQTFVIKPTISGRLSADYIAQFGFHTAIVDSGWRIKVNGTVIGQTVQNVASAAAQWATGAVKGRGFSVVAGTEYTITVEQNCTSSYCQGQQLAVRIQK